MGGMMSADIINLRRERKKRAKANKESDAATNRSQFGRSKSQKESDARESEATIQHLDAHRLPDPDEAK